VRYNRAGDVSRANGQKGGRPRLKPEQLELRELCKRQTAAAFERLKHLAFHGELETTQHAARSAHFWPTAMASRSKQLGALTAAM